MEADKEVQQLKNRFRDLADKSFGQNIYTFTGFLGLSEQAVFWQIEQELGYAGYELFGGRENADRKMVRFGNEEQLGYQVPYPIVCVHIRPLMEKFADDLSHRDFLGALMNLGIERGTLGDIRVGNKEAYLFCLDTIAPFICENLEKVRHTNVKCQVVESWQELPEDIPELLQIQVASPRLDGCIAKVYHKSRTEVLDLFRTGKVFVEGRLCENNSRVLKAGETVNVRGFGKFMLQGELRETRKGKLSIQAAVYR